MIRKWIDELLAEVGIKLPEKKKKDDLEEINYALLRRREFKPNETWEVRWESRNGEYSSDVKPEIAAFTSKQEADGFANLLRESYKILRHTSGTQVSVKRGN